jgi:hypothetical protein
LSRHLQTIGLHLQLNVEQGQNIETMSAGTLSTFFRFALLARVCESANPSVSVWNVTTAAMRGSAAAAAPAPLLQRATKRLVMELKDADLRLKTVAAGGLVIRHALELVPMLWNQFPCAFASR